jgi:hypothetical protein
VSEFLDELARSLAKPMPRRRALRLIGGAVVSASLPLGRPAISRAASFRPTNCGDPRTCADPRFPKVCGCDFLAGCYRDCCAPSDICCKFPPASGGGAPCEKACCPPDTQCGSGKPGDVCVSLCKVQCGGKCCKDTEYCANRQQQLCCKNNEVGCGRDCCKPNEECLTIRVGTGSARVCQPRCPSGRARCGSKCCPTNWRCANPSTGLCKRCGPNEEECEKKCCNRRTSRCCGKAGCCPTNRSCCVSGKTQKCCPAGEKCAIPIAPGDIGVKPGAGVVCCPKERFHSNPNICCPAGQVALLGPGQRVGPGLSPFCCPRPQLCGSVCCQKSDVLGSETCCSGKCTDVRFDPQNCGRCGAVCTSGVCRDGICAFP